MKAKPGKNSSANAARPRKAPPAQTKDRVARASRKKEIGGTDGPEPTRYGDWEHKGIASDF